VDSGSIGLIRAEYADPEKLARAVGLGLGHVHTLSDEVNHYDCYDEGGVLNFYTVVIDTAGEE
jgi:hypothetical protein